MNTRYKCAVTLDGVPLFFKRYGETPEQVINDLTQFIKEKYDCTFEITDVQPDKTHPVEKTEELPQTQPQETSDANADESRGQENI